MENNEVDFESLLNQIKQSLNVSLQVRKNVIENSKQDLLIAAFEGNNALLVGIGIKVNRADEIINFINLLKEKFPQLK